MIETPLFPEQKDAGRDRALNSLAHALRITFRLLIVALLGAMAVFLWRSFFVVEQYEAGIVLRFGQLTSVNGNVVRGDGLHVTFPYPIDEKLTVPAAGRIQTVESNDLWYSDDPTTMEQRIPPTLKPGIDGYSLTGDMTILHSQWALRYSIVQPVDYAFAFADNSPDHQMTRNFLRRLLNGAITQASAALPIDRTWADRQNFAEAVRQIVEADVEELDLGVQVTAVQPVGISPPRQVEAAFQAVTSANTISDQLLAQARAYRSQVLNAATSERVRLLTAAETFRDEKVRRADADAAYFADLYEKVQQYPELRRSMQQETLQRVLGRVNRKFIITGDEDDEIRLQLYMPSSTPKPQAQP